MNERERRGHLHDYLHGTVVDLVRRRVVNLSDPIEKIAKELLATAGREILEDAKVVIAKYARGLGAVAVEMVTENVGRKMGDEDLESLIRAGGRYLARAVAGK